MLIQNKNIKEAIDLESLLNTYKITISLDDIKKMYNHHSNFYHNFHHIEELLSIVTIDNDALILAILFHDIKFDSRSNQHEKDSADFFMTVCHADTAFKKTVEKLIMATENMRITGDDLENEIIRVDRLILHKKDINSLLNWERSIFSENQHLSVSEYKTGRIAFLNQAFEETGNHTLLEIRDIVDKKVYKIGFYPGSFNPFHVGHYNILQKAEKSFDKVVIGVGVNYDKKDIEKVGIPKTIINREVNYYSGLIITELEKLMLEGNVTVVRGLRNAYDLQHEEGLRNVIKDFLPELEFIYYFCDKKYEHISSSLIRDIVSRSDGNKAVSLMVSEYTLE
jgi:pantetheine-phosphate adenylyltransferase